MQDRFWKKVRRSEGCWWWTRAIGDDGYGRWWMSGNKVALAHRIAYEIAYGKIGQGLFVRHRCDEPSCVRPEHLVLGTLIDNARDAIERGRHGGPAGKSASTDPRGAAGRARAIRSAIRQGARPRSIEIAFKIKPDPLVERPNITEPKSHRSARDNPGNIQIEFPWPTPRLSDSRDC